MKYRQYRPGGKKEPPRYSDSIPYPKLESWMHKRIVIPKESASERDARYARRYHNALALEYMLSKLAKIVHIGNQTIRWALYRVAMGLMYLRFRIYNRIEIRGKEHIPPQGAIFLLNHFGQKDVIIFQSSFRKHLSGFVDSGNGVVADLMEKYFYFVLRRGDGSVLIEKMVQTMLLKNKYFATWPEGTVSGDQTVLEGFSGIIKVYATINANQDLVPFVPVYLQGVDCYFWHGRRRLKKIYVNYLKPIFIPRAWLKPPSEGGKTARDIINRMMMILAKVNGQPELGKNPVLNWRRQDGENPWWQGGRKRIKKTQKVEKNDSNTQA